MLAFATNGVYRYVQPSLFMLAAAAGLLAWVLL